MPELSLNHDEQDSFVRHFDGVSVAELMRREPATHPRRGGGSLELLAGG